LGSISLGQDGNDSLPANAIDPGILTGSSLANYTSSNPKPLRCEPRHGKSADFGVYVDSNDILRSQGSCTYSSLNSPDCYTAPVGSIGDLSWDGCAGMLIVNFSMLSSARGGNSFDFKPTDSYTSHDNGKTYTWTNDGNNIFTGQVTDMSYVFYGPHFTGDVSYWDTSSVTSMYGMFQHNSAFNGDISNWDTSSVTNMSCMFCENNTFNNNSPSNWCVQSVTSYGGFNNSGANLPPFGTSTNCN